MSAPEEPELHRSFSETVQRLDAAITSALGGTRIFSENYASVAIPECAELRFGFVVSSLYKLYRETGGEDLKFLNAKIGPLHGELVAHYDLVHDLRTLEQHEVNSHSPETLRRRHRCRSWFDRAVGLQSESRPAGDAAWDKCVCVLLSEAVAYLSALKSFIETLGDGMGEYVKREWLLVRTRSIPYGEFDRMVSEIAGDLGMESRDVVAFRNQYYARIVSELRAQRSDVSVVGFVRQAITARLLQEFPGVFLIADDLKEVGMIPGRKLGEALKEAQRIWSDSGFRLSKSEVMDRLKGLGFFS